MDASREISRDVMLGYNSARRDLFSYRLPPDPPLAGHRPMHLGARGCQV